MFRNIHLFLLFLLPLSAYSQERDIFNVLFWNVENLFDTERDSLKQDQEFQPASVRGWHTGRYKKKIAGIARVITAAGEWESPALVGLCEVENDRVLRDLTRYSPLKQHGYDYVMTESSDLRGIDVALLYQKDRFKLLSHQSIRPDLGAKERPTRDILHVTGLVLTLDTIDAFVVHFPSRSGGAKASEYRRLLVAKVLKDAVDSLITARKEPRVLIMGDFNDYPDNKSIADILAVQLPEREPEQSQLYHLLARKVAEENRKKKQKHGMGYGSYKYQGEWGLLDHLIVSGKLLDTTTRFYTDESKAEIVQLSFLFTKDEKHGGRQPFRTYNGMRYQGGYSDHLPVRVVFEMSFE